MGKKCIWSKIFFTDASVRYITTKYNKLMETLREIVVNGGGDGPEVAIKGICLALENST